MKCFKEEKLRIIKIMEDHLDPKTIQHVWYLKMAGGYPIAASNNTAQRKDLVSLMNFASTDC
jgi:hypothetical protein